MTCLSCWVLGSTWLSPPKNLLECSPNSSVRTGGGHLFHWSHSFLRFFGPVAVASEKVLCRVPPTILHICLPQMMLHSSSLEGSANCALHLSPSLFLGSKLLTCLTHANLVRRNHPSCRCCWGILWTYFTKSGGRYLQKNQRLSPFGNIFH